MICCKDHEIANEMGMLVNLPREAIEDGVVRNNVITEFFLTNKDDEYQIKSEYLLPDKEVTDPTTDCDACGSIEVYLLDADASNENLVFADCSNLLTLEFVDVQSARRDYSARR